MDMVSITNMSNGTDFFADYVVMESKFTPLTENQNTIQNSKENEIAKEVFTENFGKKRKRKEVSNTDIQTDDIWDSYAPQHMKFEKMAEEAKENANKLSIEQAAYELEMIAKEIDLIREKTENLLIELKDKIHEQRSLEETQDQIFKSKISKKD